MILSVLILFFGIKKKIEQKSKILIILFIIVIKGITFPSSFEGIKFLLSPNWKMITPIGVLIALRQAFFTLKLGQGTMITYGSYLSKSEDIIKSGFTVVLLIALLVGIAVFTIIFS